MALIKNPLSIPELVDLVVENLDLTTVSICALISRTWVTPCQRRLFRCISLLDPYRASRFHRHLLRYPYLQNLVQCMIMWQKVTCLGALFPLLPRLTDLHVFFDRSFRFWCAHDCQFINAFNTFLHTSQSLTQLCARTLGDETDFQQIFSFLEGTSIKEVLLDIDPYDMGDRLLQPKSNRSSNLRVVHLPAIEILRFDLANVQKLQPALNFWLSQHAAMFPNLKHCAVVVSRARDVGILFRDILQPASLQLESFRLSLSPYILNDLPLSEGLFDGLHFNHFKLCISTETGFRCDEERAYINWLSSMFRCLADPGTTIHFTELTFRFCYIEEEWATLDEVLSHSFFRDVQRIYFEEDTHEWSIISYMQPELVSLIRCALPRLASRGVLCF